MDPDKAIVEQTPEQAESMRQHEEAQHWLALREQEAGAIEQAEGLAEFYVANTRALDAEEEALAEFARRREASILRRRNALAARYAVPFEEALKSLTKKGRGKSYDTPAGRCGFRMSKRVAKWESMDEPGVIRFLEENLPEFVKMKPTYEVIKTGLVEALDRWMTEKGGGTLPAGIRIVGGNDKVYVE